MAWVFDAPTGTYRDHFLSAKIRMEAIRRFLFARWATPEMGYGKGRGASVTITRILQLPLATRVNEQDDLPEGRPAIQTKTQAVSEWGYKIPITEFEQHLTHFNIRDRFQRNLRDQISGTMDQMIAEAKKTTPVQYTPTSASGGTFDTASPYPTVATNNLKITHLREIWDYMSATLNVPTFSNGKYVGVLITKAARGIKTDPEYKDWLAPQSPEPFVSNRIASVEGFDLYETNATASLNNAAGASGVLGEAVFFGEDSCFLATVQDPMLRMEIPRDLGRKRHVGWVGTVDAGIPWDQAAQARIVYVTGQAS